MSDLLPAGVRTHLGAFLEYLWGFIHSHEAFAVLLGFVATILIYMKTSRHDRKLQLRRNYMDLEFEAINLFRVCLDNSEVVAFLEGADAEKKVSETGDKAYWLVCQVLNLFEIMISLREEEMVSSDLFNTWVSWFHELGTAKRFDAFWIKEELWSHYKHDLQKIMNVALELRLNRTHKDLSDQEYRTELQDFHDRVGEILHDPSIAQHFKKSVEIEDAFEHQIKSRMPEA
jgi:hypothetical protein